MEFNILLHVDIIQLTMTFIEFDCKSYLKINKFLFFFYFLESNLIDIYTQKSIKVK